MRDKFEDGETYTSDVSHCSDCKEKLNKFIAFVVISNNPNEHKTSMKQEEANRTGEIAWIKKHVANELFNTTITTSMVFIDIEGINKIKGMMPKGDEHGRTI